MLDFDNSTGYLSNIISDSIGGVPEPFIRGYGAEFAPNGQLVYMSDLVLLNGGGLAPSANTDLTGPDPMNTGSGVGYENRVRKFPTCPDGKLYMARLNGATYLSAITNPDVVGPGCGFVDNAVSLGANPSTWGLPNHWDTYPTPPPDDPIALRDTELLCADSDPITLDATWTHPFQTPSYL
ncbi:MAG: hypothetical protein IPL64_04410 [Flavobacteriales bacterium]|nr:hypothetical protein [Flavobacteriales bacterium]